MSSIHSWGEGPTQASLIHKCTGGCVFLGSIEGLRDFCVSNRTTGHQNSMFHTIQEGASVCHLSIPFHCLCSCATVNSSARNSKKIPEHHETQQSSRYSIVSLFHWGLRPSSLWPTRPAPHDQPTEQPCWDLKSKFHTAAKLQRLVHF